MHAKRPTNDYFPANYEQLNWCIKRSILDSVRLVAWEAMNRPRIVPSENDARKIGLDPNWRTYLDQESRDIIDGRAIGRGDFAVAGGANA